MFHNLQFRSPLRVFISNLHLTSHKCLLEGLIERVRFEGISLTLVELVLEFDPVEAQSVESTLDKVHQHDDAEGNGPEDGPENEGANSVDNRALDSERRVRDHDVQSERQIEEHLRKLTVCQGQGPESEVGGGVGDSSEHKLDSLDDLVNHHIGKGVRLGLRIHSLELLSKRLDFVLAFSHDKVDLVLGLRNLAVVATTLTATTAAVHTSRHGLIDSSRRRTVSLMQLDLIFDVVGRLAIHDAWLDAKHDGYRDEDKEDEDRRSRVDSANVGSQVRYKISILCAWLRR